MDSRENALRILRFDRPERVTSGLPTVDCSYFGVNHESRDGQCGHSSPVGTRWHDIWGVGWHRALEGVMGFAVEHPLADLSRLDDYPLPDPDDPAICGPIYDRARAANRTDRFLAGSHRETLWERCYNLVGMDRLMMAFYDEPEAVRQLMRRVMDFQLAIARHYLAVGVEVAGLGDDLGSERGPLFSRSILEEFLAPEYRRLCDLYRAHGVIIAWHSCGRIDSLLDFFMDLGVDVLNPVQASANDLDRVRAITQGKMALQGAVSTRTIMSGPEEAIRAETALRLWQLGREGGYFCAPDQGMPFPPAHAEAFRVALEEYGMYPLREPAVLPGAAPE